jgi:hypothetical protein
LGVRFHCRGCQASHDVPVSRVVERLKARGLGDEQTGVRAVAWLADHPYDAGLPARQSENSTSG